MQTEENQPKQGEHHCEQGLGDGSNNGKILWILDVFQENNLVIGCTIFMHKDIHKTTLHSPDGETKN